MNDIQRSTKKPWIDLCPDSFIKSLCTMECEIEFLTHQGPVSRKSREFYGPEKPVVELQSACFQKLIFKDV